MDLPRERQSKNVYNLFNIFQIKTKFELKWSSTKTTQCDRCQGFEHSQITCHPEAACIKYEESHYSTEYTKPMEEKVKRVRCFNKLSKTIKISTTKDCTTKQDTKQTTHYRLNPHHQTQTVTSLRNRRRLLIFDTP